PWYGKRVTADSLKAVVTFVPVVRGVSFCQPAVNLNVHCARDRGGRRSLPGRMARRGWHVATAVWRAGESDYWRGPTYLRGTSIARWRTSTLTFLAHIPSWPRLDCEQAGLLRNIPPKTPACCLSAR